MISLSYLLVSNISLMLVIGLYRFCLERLTFFKWNRAYLVGGLLCSLLVPLISLPTLNWAAPGFSKTVSGLVTKVVIVSQQTSYPGISSTDITLTSLIIATYLLVASYYCFKLILDIYSVVKLARHNPRQQTGSIYIVWVADNTPTSSFFNYVFLNKKECKGEAINVAFTHEQVHSQQWHTIDWLLVRFVSALFWYNPVMPHWRRAITLNNEYIADSQTVETYDSFHYAHLLVSLAAQPGPSLTLQYFSYGQLKSRIVMLHQLRSQAIYRMRFLLVAPLLGMMLTMSSCGELLISEMDTPSILAKGDYLFKDLIGTWTNVNRKIINGNGTYAADNFPERAGDSHINFSKLVLSADGKFQMLDERSGQTLLGHWESDQAGVSVQLHFIEPSSSSKNIASEKIYRRDGTAATNLYETIHLDVTSLKEGKMEAWQSYADGSSSSGESIYSKYQKQ